MSKFAIVNQRYIMKDTILVCTVLSPAYSNPILETIREIEGEKGDEYATKVLSAMLENSRTLEHIRKPSNADEYVLASLVKPSPPPQTINKSSIGQKYVCSKCSSKFYDLNGRVKACPSCQTPIKDLTC